MTILERNTLFYGDNLDILREHFPDACVDLIYLDPPFNSNRSYNVLFRDESGKAADAQITAFDDTWHWGDKAEETFNELRSHARPEVFQMIDALRAFIGSNQMMAYLVMMAARLAELHRVLKPTGSLYLHCDPTASHYLKIVLDTIFEGDQFRSEIIWKRSHSHNSAKRYGPIHDVIFFYSKSERYNWNDIRQDYTQEYLDLYFKFDDHDGRGVYWTGDITGSGTRKGETGKPWRGFDPTSKGRHWMYPPDVLEELDADNRIFWPKSSEAWPKLKRYHAEAKGVPLQDLWDDIYGLSTMGGDKKERLGYPTQKPLALLERIIQASSNPGDIVLDPFCGCGTAVAAAQKLGRRWIGIDITHLALYLQKKRLKDAFKLEPRRDYQVIGEPVDLASAHQLAQEDRYQFQWWALSLIEDAKPLGGDDRTGKKGKDAGIDGIAFFVEGARGKAGKIIIQVKSGSVKSGDIRDLAGVLAREKADIGVFVTLHPPTKDMLKEATLAGYYHSDRWQKDYPRLQILTIQQLLAGAVVQSPATINPYKKAEVIPPSPPEQGKLDL